MSSSSHVLLFFFSMLLVLYGMALRKVFLAGEGTDPFPIPTGQEEQIPKPKRESSHLN